MNASYHRQNPLLEAKNICHDYPGVAALDNVNLQVYRGECLGIVGESGCGKSTLARILTRIETPTSGNIHFRGTEITTLKKQALKEYRRHIQMVFQNPADVFSPRMNIETFLCESLLNYGIMKHNDARQEAARLLHLVGLDSSYLPRLPHQLSCGQLQRVVIARAISIHPQIVLFDEATSSLDVIIQKKILHLLAHLQRELELTYIFIGHDLSVVRSLCRRIVVLYHGRVIEILQSEHLAQQARHPYTQELLASVFSVHDSKNSKTIHLFSDNGQHESDNIGCNYAARCHRCMDICHREKPQPVEVEAGHTVACHAIHSSGIR